MYDPKRGYPAVVPCILYDDVPQAVTWLERALGFREMVRATMPDGWTGHSELSVTASCCCSAAGGRGWPTRHASPRSTSTT